MEYDMKMFREIFLAWHLSSFDYILAQIYEENEPAFKYLLHKQAKFNPPESYHLNKLAA